MKLLELPVLWSNTEEFDLADIEPDLMFVNPDLVFCVHDSTEVKGCSTIRDSSGTGYIVPLTKDEVKKKLTEVNRMSFLLFFIAGLFNGGMDMIKFNWNRFIFQTEWWLERGEWAPGLRSWLLKHVATMFAGGWHLLKFLMVITIVGTVLIYSPLFAWWIDLILMFGVFSAGFILGYYFLWRKK